jgi:multicomponent K+:H+ antiporter subunit G
MDDLSELLVSALLVIGASFLLIGSFALAKLPDTLRRLHGPTKATTLGVGSVLIASMFYFLFERGSLSVHELLITLFLFLTAPVSAHLIAKAYLHATSQPRNSSSREDRASPHH